MRATGVAAALTVLGMAVASPTADAEPVVEPVAADPSVVRADDGKYYMYTTADDWGDGNGVREMAIFESTDLVEWSEAGTVFDDRPSWVPDGAGLWAPDVHSANGKYNLYYSVGGVSDPCIGYATAPTPTGPWTDLGREVFCASDVGVGGTIDPYVWSNGNSKTIFVGNFKGIFAIPLNSAGTEPAGDPVQVADKRFEAAYVKQHGGFYYLFVSAGNCCRAENTAYRVLVGRSAKLTGPYLDRKGQDLNEGGGALILAGDDKYAGPGHNAIATDDAGDDWIVYHATPRNDLYLDSGVQRREGFIDKIEWANGWPEVGDGSPSSTSDEVPDVDQPDEDALSEENLVVSVQ
ncbi:family 43 glycosylhydrolase [Antrihabitans sp. YC2-6]|uniref:family 43 glycosylhydrolase n=1 Tax=Antrihabitans sp. YC2-6 TaxID=2799498 RepID=UPI0018F49CF1|nr:family 43 glycosylhydrolase [Antrihabitans sp. YC2-6]MBJ8345707.1 family 43 glycosylhydrolase [Antrihabitans sp. YC2-6]